MRFLPKDKAFDTDMVPVKRIAIQAAIFHDNHYNYRKDIQRAEQILTVDHKNSLATNTVQMETIRNSLRLMD